MKIPILLIMASSVCFSAPYKEQNIPKITGEIIYGRWIGDLNIEISDVVIDGDPYERKLNNHAIMILALRNVEGMDVKQINEMNVQFIRYLSNNGYLHLIDNHIKTRALDEKTKKDKFMLMVVPCEDSPKHIRLNNKITISGIVYKVDDFGGFIHKFDGLKN